MEELDKSIFQGRLLHILPAKRPPAAPEPKQYALFHLSLNHTHSNMVVYNLHSQQGEKGYGRKKPEGLSGLREFRWWKQFIERLYSCKSHYDSLLD